MRFTLIDRIVDLQPGARITAVKNLSLAEEYLADHFPGFPVLPGVLMLEAMTQAAAWLVRVTDDFAHSMVVLKEARNVKYNQFVEPGQTLTVTAEVLEAASADPARQDAGGQGAGRQEADRKDAGRQEVKLRAVGTVGGEQAVSARLVLARYNLAEADAGRELTDQIIKHKMRELLALLHRPLLTADRSS